MGVGTRFYPPELPASKRNMDKPRLQSQHRNSHLKKEVSLVCSRAPTLEYDEELLATSSEVVPKRS